MAKYTVEVTYYVPTYRHVVVHADSPAAAVEVAVAIDLTHTTEKVDYECQTPDFVTGIWEGGEAYEGVQHEVPAEWCRDHRILNE